MTQVAALVFVLCSGSVGSAESLDHQSLRSLKLANRIEFWLLDREARANGAPPEGDKNDDENQTRPLSKLVLSPTIPDHLGILFLREFVGAAEAAFDGDLANLDNRLKLLQNHYEQLVTHRDPQSRQVLGGALEAIATDLMYQFELEIDPRAWSLQKP